MFISVADSGGGGTLDVGVSWWRSSPGTSWRIAMINADHSYDIYRIRQRLYGGQRSELGKTLKGVAPGVIVLIAKPSQDTTTPA